ncbi:hypothetical protein DSOL_3455 [Desulfosporosinus metallidurans]|uniref:Uncharacterized protein n=1 Tax=Desulfosporosinus metallidurans TaxID=1888891 RepID=A0A1Q8QQG7_9FIRM|nr:hypothetical protein DSOL_3455 [Desulfosporosinus metallidurans]
MGRMDFSKEVLWKEVSLLVCHLLSDSVVLKIYCYQKLSQIIKEGF